MSEISTIEHQDQEIKQHNTVWELIKRVTEDPVLEPVEYEPMAPLSLKTKIAVGLGIVALAAGTIFTGYSIVESSRDNSTPPPTTEAPAISR